MNFEMLIFENSIKKQIEMIFLQNSNQLLENFHLHLYI
jgi:hypothetical protein